jgi:hypothetical protein
MNGMRRPFEIELPLNRGVGQLAACMNTLLRGLGFDLGKRYDGHMRPRFGAEWLEQLRVRRLQETGDERYRRKLNKYDPSFTLNEPLRDSASPLREALPRGSAFYDKVERVIRIRNREQHFDGIPTLDRLEDDVRALRDLAGEAQLALVTDCDRVLERTGELRKKGRVADPAVVELMDELRRQADGARERAKAMAKDLAEQRERERELLRRIQELASQGAKAGAYARQLESMERLLDDMREGLEETEAAQAAAEEQARAAQEELRRLLAKGIHEGEDPELDRLAPGDAWPTAPGSRVLRLMSHVRDLYDPAGVALLSDELGGSAVDAAREWLNLLPHGGTVHLDDRGYACALKGGAFVYLGRLRAYAGDAAPEE